MKGLITMKKLIPLFLAAILLLCNIFAGNALAANETAPETRSIPTGVASATPHETDLFFFDEGVDPQAADLFTRHDITFSSHGPNAARVTVNLETADNVKKLGFTKLTFQYWNGSSWAELSSVRDEYINNSDYFGYYKVITNLVAGDYYRVQVECYAKKSLLSAAQKVTLTTAYIVCK